MKHRALAMSETITVVYTADASGRPDVRAPFFFCWCNAGVGVGCSSFCRKPSPSASQLQQLPIALFATHFSTVSA